jgi:transcriptional regulator with XRE-family HTH domain
MTMRRMRGEAGVSLRDLESRGAWRRSTISQVENGKARPSRQLVEWYDAELGSDGLLLSMYAEARSRQLLVCPDELSVNGGRAHGGCAQCDGMLQVVDIDPPTGLLVERGANLRVRVTLRNTSGAAWRDRHLHRMGAYAGRRLIGSAPKTLVPDTDPGQAVDVLIEVQAPDLAGSVIAYWCMRDGVSESAAGDISGECSQSSAPVALVLLVS